MPAQVYWRRRLVVLAVLAALVLMLWRVTAGAQTANPRATDTGPTETAPIPTPLPEHDSELDRAPEPARGEPDRRDRKPKKLARERRRDGREGAERARSKQRQVVTTTLPKPSGECSPADVVVVPDVEDAYAYAPVDLRLGLSTQTAPACTVSLSAGDLALEVTSGDDLVWRLDACPTLQEREVVLRAGWLTYVTVPWSGQRAVDSCSPRQPFAEPGYYWAEAALLGGEPHRGQFRLTPPPPPKPAQRRAPQGADDDSGERPDYGGDARGRRAQDEPVHSGRVG